MMLGLVLRVSGICFLLFNSGACYPAVKGGQTNPNAAATSGLSGSLPYAAAPAAGGLGYRPVPYGNPAVAGVPGGADSSFYNPSNWMPSRGFPDFSVWETDNQEMAQSGKDQSDVPPPAIIIQSWNGYQRAREDLSHTKYSLDYYDPPAFPWEAAKAPSKTSERRKV